MLCLSPVFLVDCVFQYLIKFVPLFILYSSETVGSSFVPVKMICFAQK